MNIPTTGSKPKDGYLFGPRQAWFAFAMTIGLMLFDYIDRQVIVSLFPYMKADWGLSDKQLGALVSALSIVLAACALPVSLVADRVSRVKSIVTMATLWSIASISCMFTRNYSAPAGGARHGRRRRGRLRCSGRRTDCDPLPRSDAQRAVGQLHGSRFRGLRAGRRARRRHRRALGLACRVRRGRHSRPRAEPCSTSRCATTTRSTSVRKPRAPRAQLSASPVRPSGH